MLGRQRMDENSLLRTQIQPVESFNLRLMSLCIGLNILPDEVIWIS